MRSVLAFSLCFCCFGPGKDNPPDAAAALIKKFNSSRTPESAWKAIEEVEKALATADSELKNKIISAMRAAIKEKLDDIVSKLPKKPSSRLVAERKALNALAAEALKEIARKEYEEGSPQRHEIQKKIDGIVAEMKKIWSAAAARPLSSTLLNQYNMAELYRDFCAKWEKELVPEFDDFAFKFAQGTATSVRDFPLDMNEALVISKSRAVDNYNERLFAKHGGKSPGLSKEAYDHLKILNDYRNMMGLPSLILNLRLTNAAYLHSIEMSKARRIWHEGPDGTPADRAKKARFQGSSSGENVYQGVDSPLGAFMYWYNSPQHHKNMVNKRYENIGVGFATDTWTQHFGASAGLVELN